MMFNIFNCERPLRFKYGFTLIEMLVVIAIIAILAALLSPALRRAMLSVNQASCNNNLRQIGMCYYNYLSDFNGYCPPTFGDTSYSAAGYYHVMMERNGYWPKEIFYCPEMAASSFNWQYSPHYGINIYVPKDNFTPRSVYQVKKASSKLLIMDSWEKNSDSMPNMDRGSYRVYFSNTGMSYTGMPAGRHANQNCNILWLDAHCSSKEIPSIQLPWQSPPFSISLSLDNIYM